jgi:NhaP-type Na+/H+ or K+/H+ antiporter
VTAISLRQSEITLARDEESNQRRGASSASSHQPRKIKPHGRSEVSEGSLRFKEPLERLSELVLVVLLGGMLFTDSWSLRAVCLGLFLFLVVRPVSVFLGLLGSGASWRLQMLVGWFGVRGIGSLYYLMFAVVFGLPEEMAVELIHITLVVVVLSIIVHGLTVKPMMTRWWGP